MKRLNRKRQAIGSFVSALAVWLSAAIAVANVPIDGFFPLVGIALTDEFNDDFVFSPIPTSSPSGGNLLGPNGTAFYDVALLDTGAGFSLLTDQAYDDFNLDGPYPGEPDGYAGTETVPIGGATGTLVAPINDPFGLYAGGLQGRTSAGAALTINHAGLKGQTNTSTITLPAESELPNVLGLPFASQYATRIRSDSPQVFELAGKTVRTPAIDFLPLGSGGNGIARKAPLSLNPGASFTSPPSYLLNIGGFDIDKPQENPSLPTLTQGGLFLNVDASNEGTDLGTQQFFFDTGASVTVVSELNALSLGFDILTDEPEFTISIVGSGGTTDDVPGFFVDEITIVALGGSITATNVPVLILDVPDPSDSGNPVAGIVGTNLLSGRNLVIDPNPSIGGGGASAGVYISDTVTNDFQWTSNATSAPWSTAGAWNAAATPDYLSVTEVRHTAGGNQEAVVVGNQKAWNAAISGGASGETMTVRIGPASKLTTFSGVTIEEGGVVSLQLGTLDAQFVDIRGGKLTGAGFIQTGSGPIAGQVENILGTVAPGVGAGRLIIDGRFSQGTGGVLEIELGGLGAGATYDQLVIHGTAAIGGTLEVSLIDSGSGLFEPNIGDTFTLMTFETGGGVFDSLDLPTAYLWDIDYLSTSVVLELTGLAGDYNLDGTVDAADYTVWRDGLGSTYVAADYNVWVDNFGNSLLATSTSVPEPATWLLTLIAFAASRVRCADRRVDENR